MEKVGRNDLCPCGSGKKYKKCCGESNVISIESLLDKELRDLQVDIIDFAVNTYEEEMNNFLAQRLSELFIPEEALEMFHFFTVSWYITSIEIEGKTILEQYIDKNSYKWTRRRIKDILLSWKKTKPIIAIVQDQNESKLLTLEDIFTNDIYKVKVLDDDHPVETDGIVIGTILPVNEFFVFFTSFIDLPANLTNRVKEAVFQLLEDNEETNPTHYLNKNYPEALNLFVFGPEPTMEDLEWISPKHYDVAHGFKDYMANSHDEIIIKLGTYLWHQYCSKRNPKIVKTGIYIAALIYLIDQLIPFGGWMTRNQLAEEFDISSSSLSAKYKDIEKTLKDEIEDLEEKLNNIDFEEIFDDTSVNDDEDLFYENDEDLSNNHSHTSISTERELFRLESDLQNQKFESLDEVNLFLNQRINNSHTSKKALSDKVKAQELLYDAYESSSEIQKKQLAKKALELYPNSPDAYIIYADFEFNPQKEEELLLKAIEAGEKDLGEKFIGENIGDFWGIVRTRPYMRAKFKYAELLRDTDRLVEAIKQYEELLELNQHDNQGVRYELLTALMERGLFKEAEALLNKFNESMTANGTYNRVLIEFFQNGVTSKVKLLLQNAKQQNPFVPDYLLGKKNIPLFLPNDYQLGEKSEAIIYADQHIEFWESASELMDLLKKTR
ncbi:SEC-C metal-binding domain-containing protein [Niallia sp. XMNu-256]|uniref:SEC-C metal-binding domain-containing protein n=1 Tax=Niallia sp. XMNu-256 TaxID=3082444 RepID=UPI0030CF57ED